MAMPEFCPGYFEEPYRSLATDYPDVTVYPQTDFRTEWGPVFHRGRLDGTARVFLMGQDPGQHENVLHRILSGEAGRRVQGLLAKIGINRSYVLINALLYSVFGDGGAKFVAKPKVAAYRNESMKAILGGGSVQAVVTFGGMAEKAWGAYVKTNTVPATIQVHHPIHPTFPESAGGTKAQKAANTKKLLTQWNGALQELFGAVEPDVELPALVLYGDTFADADKADIPAFDLPPGTPPWQYDDDGWTQRLGTTPGAKRANITITVPKVQLP
jgi:hypothetical protein